MRQPLLRSLLVPSLVATFIVLGQGVIAPAHGACDTVDGRCRCGDRVISDTVLSGQDPVLGGGACPCDGLVVAATVKKLVISGTIKGSGVCTGIRLEPGVTNGVVTQGHIQNFSVGIDASGGVTRSRFSKLQILDNEESGILLAGNDNIIEGSIVRGSFILFGIDVSGDRNVVQSNKTEDTNRISVNGVGNTVSRNQSVRDGGFNISGQNAVVDSNKATDGFGFNAEGTGHTFTKNYSARNFLPGFAVSGTSHRFTKNSATANFFEGFSVDATGSTFEGNLSNNNGDFGIRDGTTGGGTSGTANTYTSNGCTGNASGDSDPQGLC